MSSYQAALHVVLPDSERQRNAELEAEREASVAEKRGWLAQLRRENEARGRPEATTARLGT